MTPEQKEIALEVFKQYRNPRFSFNEVLVKNKLIDLMFTWWDVVEALRKRLGDDLLYQSDFSDYHNVGPYTNSRTKLIHELIRMGAGKHLTLKDYLDD